MSMVGKLVGGLVQGRAAKAAGSQVAESAANSVGRKASSTAVAERKIRRLIYEDYVQSRDIAPTVKSLRVGQEYVRDGAVHRDFKATFQWQGGRPVKTEGTFTPVSWNPITWTDGGNYSLWQLFKGLVGAR
jgi:hypothetical protein